MPLRAYTDKYIEAFLVDRQLLNMEDPEFLVRATDCIPGHGEAHPGARG